MEETQAAYAVRVTKDFSRISFSGTLRLQGRQEYERIYRMLRYAAEKSGDSLEIDLRQLQFLNSSGISTFSLFIIEMREVGKGIVITGKQADRLAEQVARQFPKALRQGRRQPRLSDRPGRRAEPLADQVPLRLRPGRARAPTGPR